MAVNIAIKYHNQVLFHIENQCLVLSKTAHLA